MAEIVDKENYIYNYLNSKSSTISFYVPRIIKGNSLPSEIQKYIERIVALIEEVKQIMNKMGIKSVPVNGFFNELYLLRDQGIKEINMLLAQFRYQDVLNREYTNVLRKISLNNQIYGTEKRCIEFLINNHLVEDEELVFEHFLRNVLLNEADISYDSFETLLVDYLKKRMAIYVSNPTCEIVNEKERAKRQNCVFSGEIYLCREDIQNLYYSGVFTVIKSMFHSLGHVRQYKDIIIDKKSSPTIIKQIKEEILSKNYPGYYDSNIEYISYEAEAEAFGITETLRLFERFGIGFKNGKNPYLPTLIKLSMDYSKSVREVNGHQDTVDGMFDSIVITHPELLEMYPQLRSEYSLDNAVKKESL